MVRIESLMTLKEEMKKLTINQRSSRYGEKQ